MAVNSRIACNCDRWTYFWVGVNGMAAVDALIYNYEWVFAFLNFILNGAQ